MPPVTNPWTVTSQTPAAAPPPQNNPWAVASQAPAPAAAPRTGMQRLNDALTGASDPDEDYQAPELGGMLSGALKSASGLAANVLDFISRPRNTPMQEAVAGSEGKPAPTPEATKASQHVQDAARWLRSGGQPDGFWENLGAVGEQVLEYIGTDGLLKLAGAPLKAGEAVNRGAQATEQLKQAQQVAGVLAGHPKLAGIVAVGLKALKDATMLGGQTYAHTEDPEQAVIAGAIGGTGRAAAEGVGAAGRYLGSLRPKVLSVAGEEIPALASQVNESGMPNATGAEGAPKIAKAQQAGAQQVIQNVAQGATSNAIDKINQTRGAFTPIEDTGRMLPAPEGAEPFTFTLEAGNPPIEGRTEMTLQPANKFDPTASRVPEGGTPGAQNKAELGSEAATIPDRMQKRTQAFTSETGEPAADEARGGGTLQTTDPAEAQNWMRQIEEIQQSPLHDRLTPGQQTQLETQRKALEEQLGLYHSSPYAQRFDPVDTGAAINQVRTFGDAADQVEAAAKPVFQTLDRISNGEFAKWNGAAQQAQRVIRSATSVEAVEKAQQRLSEANTAIDQLITRHAGEISRADYTTAKMAWRNSSRLNELHGVFERMMNGITAEESDQGFTRVMTGRTRLLAGYLAKSDNQAQLEGLIGKEGVTNLKQITQLLSKANTARSANDVLKNVFLEIGRHARMGGVGGAIGGAVAHAIGAPWFEGMMTGAALTEGMRAVMRDAATNPRIGNMVDWAARNGLSPQHYAPLIARAITTPMQEQGQDNASESTGAEEPGKEPIPQEQ